MSEQGERPRRRRRTEPAPAQPTQGSVARGVILVVVAVVIGLLLLRDDDSRATQVAVGTDGGSEVDDAPDGGDDAGDTATSTTTTTASEMRMRMTERAATAASAEFSTYLSTCTGRVGRPDSATNSEITASSKETMKAMTPPAITPGWMIGSVTRRNTVQESAPRMRAAASQEVSVVARLINVVLMTNGMVMATWPMMMPA